MFLKIATILLLSLLTASSGYLTNKDELRRQYADYRKIHNKEETTFGFDLFIENLQKVESFNANNVDCRMFLTQYSDTYDDQSTYTKCYKRRSSL